MSIEKIKIEAPIVVEGTYDKIKLESFVDGVIITTNGFGIYKNKEKMKMLRDFASKTGILVITDSDAAGFQIRNFIRSNIKDGTIYNAYIPDLFGKERRKTKASSEGKLGVEGVSVSVIRDAIIKSGIEINGKSKISHKNQVNDEQITNTDLYEDGFTGCANSKQLRYELTKKLNLPENISKNSLLKVINMVCTREEYRNIACEIKCNEEGCKNK